MMGSWGIGSALEFQTCTGIHLFSIFLFLKIKIEKKINSKFDIQNS